jgi:hypothetical protein
VPEKSGIENEKLKIENEALAGRLNSRAFFNFQFSIFNLRRQEHAIA